MFRTILMILIFIAILSITISLTKTETETMCPPSQIVYRYIPRTLEEEMEDPGYISDIFRAMFAQPSPWINNVDNDMDRKKEQVNKYFISQL